jgi:hypothetical protein
VASLIQDLEIVELILGDIAAVAGGKQVSQTQTIGSVVVTVGVVVLPNGPTGTGYQVIEGNFWSILMAVFADAAAIASGAPVMIAEKIGNTWYGSTFSVAPKT